MRDETAHTVVLNPEEERAYSYSIGGVFINFGMIEILSYQWVSGLGRDPIVMRDMAIDMRLCERIDLIKELIDRVDWPSETKLNAINLWSEASKLSQIRNRIAHNPFIRGKNRDGHLVSGIANGKKMKEPGPYEYELLEADEITKAALRAGVIGRELAAFLPRFEEGKDE